MPKVSARVSLLVWAALLLGCADGAQDAPRPLEPAAPPPAASRVRILSPDGVPIAYDSSGAGSTALVFIHGWSADRDYWALQVEAFLVEYRVVTIDLAGHGRSGAGRTDWTVEAFGRDVAAVVEALDLDLVVLIGHFMGGLVALETARLMPGRVIGVVGVDTMHDVEFEWPPEWNELLAVMESDFPTACRGFVRPMFDGSTDPDLVARATADLCAAPPGPAIALLRALPTYDIAGALGDLEVPLRLINSASIETRLEVARKYAPDVEVVVLDGVGHFPMLERPEAFNQALADVLDELTVR